MKPKGSDTGQFKRLGVLDCPQQDVFFWLKKPTIAKIRALFRWAHERAMRTDVYCRDSAELTRDVIEEGEEKFEAILGKISSKAKPYFRVILREDGNWYLLFSNEAHVEDYVEIGIRGIDIGSKEYFIRCFLRKEFMPALQKKFSLGED